MTIQYQIAEKNFILINCENLIQNMKIICNWIKAHVFLLCSLANWKFFVANKKFYFFFSINHHYKKYQTTSTFSLKPLVGATLALKALLNSRSSLPLASDDVMTYTPLPGRWYPHSL